MIRLKKYFAVSALSSILCWSGGTQAESVVAPALTASEASPTVIQQKTPIHALRSAPLQLNLRHLQHSVKQFRQAPDKPEAIALKLFDDTELAIVPERIEGKSDTTFNFIGKLQEKEQGHAIFVVKDGNIVGNIRTNGKLFKIRPTGNGAHHIDNRRTLNNTAATVAGFRQLGVNENGDTMGHAVASGDFNGDGYLDLAIGAPYEAPGADPKSGYVFIFRGNISGLQSWQGLDQAGLGSNEANDKFGYALVAGDFNGDNHDDLAIGAPGEAPGADPRSSYTFIFQGSAIGPRDWQGLSQEM